MFIDLLSYLTSLIKDINFNVNFINIDSVLPTTLFNTKKNDNKLPTANETANNIDNATTTNKSTGTAATNSNKTSHTTTNTKSNATNATNASNNAA